MKGKILKGKNIILRPIKLSDAPNYVRWFKDKEVTKFLTVKPLTLLVEQKWIRSSWRNKNEVNWALEIFDKHIGGTGLRLDPQNKTGNWGIVIGEKKEWGKGCGTEVGKICLDFVFKDLKYNRFDLEVFMSNKRALKVYKKIGFQLEGVKRKSFLNTITRRYEDIGIMSILKEEWLINKII